MNQTLFTLEPAKPPKARGFLSVELEKLFKPKPYNIFTLVLADAKQKALYMEYVRLKQLVPAGVICLA
jgi:hypothetical protein